MMGDMLTQQFRNVNQKSRGPQPPEFPDTVHLRMQERDAGHSVYLLKLSQA